MSIKPTQPIVLGKPTAHISIICATGALTASQFSPAAAGSQVSGHKRSSFRSHPHLLPRPYPCPLSAPWHATSAPLVVAACRDGEERNREVSWRVWMTRRLLCACSVFALPLRGLFFRPHVLSSRTCTRLRCLPARRARKPVRQLRPGPLFDASAQLGRRLARRRSDKVRLAFNWPHRP
jgi:hypothetical protein